MKLFSCTAVWLVLGLQKQLRMGLSTGKMTSRVPSKLNRSVFLIHRVSFRFSCWLTVMGMEPGGLQERAGRMKARELVDQDKEHLLGEGRSGQEQVMQRQSLTTSHKQTDA